MVRKFSFLVLFYFLSVFAFAETAREYFESARSNYDLKDYKKALALINKAIDIEPNYVNGLLLRAKINYGLSNYSDVVNDVTSAFELDEESGSTMAAYHLLRGEAYYQLKNLEKAEIDINHCLKLNPESARAYFLKAEIDVLESRYFDAVEYFDLAIKYDSDESDFYLKRAELKKIYYKPMPDTETYLSIMDDINLATALNPDDHRAYKLKCEMIKLDDVIKKRI